MSNQKDLEPFFEPLESLQNLLAQFDNQGVIIGGIAAGILGKARYTDDLDAVFLLSVLDVQRLLDAAEKEGIGPRIENVIDFARRTRVVLLKHNLSNTNIDISLGILPFEQEMVKRSILYKVDDTLQIRLPTPEDLIIMKAIAHRPKDMEDIRTIADKHPNLDRARIEQWVKSFADILELPDLWKSVQEILDQN